MDRDKLRLQIVYVVILPYGMMLLFLPLLLLLGHGAINFQINF